MQDERADGRMGGRVDERARAFAAASYNTTRAKNIQTHEMLFLKSQPKSRRIYWKMKNKKRISDRIAETDDHLWTHRLN